MPELLEVYTILKQLEPHILNKPISRFSVSAKGLKLIAPEKPKSFFQKISGRSIVMVKRYGKFMVFLLDNEQQIVGHLRMSGRLTYSPKLLKHKHKRLHIKFAGAGYLNFIDVRRFGTFHLVSNIGNYQGLQNLGIDALSPALSAEELYWKFQVTGKNIYKALLDQAIIAGLGNIYVNEALYATGIRPVKKAKKLSLQEVRQLLVNIRLILKAAISFKGTTLLDKTYLDSGGETGKFYKRLRVYSREGKPCYKCKTLIKRVKIANRSAYYCPKCQKN